MLAIRFADSYKIIIYRLYVAEHSYWFDYLVLHWSIVDAGKQRTDCTTLTASASDPRSDDPGECRELLAHTIGLVNTKMRLASH